jgi:DNA-binding MarR family transcriptional regulator
MKTHRPRRAASGRTFVRDYLSYLLAQASYAVYKGFDARVRAAGLSSIEWRVLATLSDGDGLTIGELAREVLAQQPTLTKLVDRMERAGLVERRGDETDGRRTLVFETPRGRARVAPLLLEAKAHERAALTAFAPPEADALKRALRALCEPRAADRLSRSGQSTARSGRAARRRNRTVTRPR